MLENFGLAVLFLLLVPWILTGVIYWAVGVLIEWGIIP